MPGQRRARYSWDQLHAYTLDPVRNETGQILRYRVVVAGDVLGTIEHPGGGHDGWIARDTHAMSLPHRAGNGRYAKNRRHAVVDLLMALGYTGHER